MNKTNIAIIGAGIVGSNISYILNKNKIENALLEQSSTIFDNASGCAGAFITPTIGKNSDIKTFLDNAFCFSSNFYNKLNKSILHKGTICLIDKYEKEYEKNIPHQYEKISKYAKKGYFFPDALTIDPFELAKELTKDANIIYNYKAEDIKYENSKWIINNNLQANKIIIASGYNTSLINEPYIDIRGVHGTKINISSDTKINYSVNKDIYFSKQINNQISIGATHHREKYNDDIKTKDTKYLLEKMQDIVSMQNTQVQSIKNGIRACSKDYFPIVGSIIDSKKTLEKFPSIKHGTKIAKKDFIAKKNIFICNGVGGRGFTLAPYISNILVNHILNKSSIDSNLTCHKRFIKFYRRKNNHNI